MVSVTRSDGIKRDEDVKDRFITKVVDKTTELVIDTVTGVEYIKVYPTQFKEANETVTLVALLDESGFPSINEQWRDGTLKK